MIINFIDQILQESSQPASTLLPLDRVGVIILAGGEGKRLEPLTHFRCKPAIPFGGRYALIDVPISHALSSGLKRIYVIGQYLASSLQRHLFQSYLSYGASQNQIEMLVPEEREGKRIWYQGTADAIRQNLNYFAEMPVDYFLILSGDQLYNINFQSMIRFGLETDASLVIAAQPVAEKEAGRMGILKIEPGGTRLIDFYEKPKDPETLKAFFTSPATLYNLGFDGSSDKNYLGSMGIYFFRRQALFDLLKEDNRADFGHHLIKTEMEKKDTHVFLYDGYWEDIGTIESYFKANLALARGRDDRKEGFQLYDESQPIFTKASALPSAKILGTRIQQSLVAEGSQIFAEEITNSIIGMRSLIGRRTIIRESILMGNEAYEFSEFDGVEKKRIPGIGEDCQIVRTIIDENVTIGNRVRLINQNHQLHYDSPEGAPLLFVRDGIIIIPRGAHIPDNFVF